MHGPALFTGLPNLTIPQADLILVTPNVAGHTSRQASFKRTPNQRQSSISFMIDVYNTVPGLWLRQWPNHSLLPLFDISDHRIQD